MHFTNSFMEHEKETTGKGIAFFSFHVNLKLGVATRCGIFNELSAHTTAYKHQRKELQGDLYLNSPGLPLICDA